MNSGTEGLTGQEVCPKYSVEHVKAPDGSKVTVQIAVALPGVADSTTIQFVVQERLCTVSVPGRYHVAIPLAEPVERTAEVVRFVKKKAVLRCVLRIQDSHLQGKQQAEQMLQQGRHSVQNSAQRGPATNSKTAGTTQEAAVSAQQPQPAAGARTNGKAAPPAPHQQQQQPQKQQRAPVDPPVPSQPDVYAQAKLQANKDAAEDCERLARNAEQLGDWQRAVRLWQKACQLFSDNNQYQQAFKEASRRLAAAGEPRGSFTSAGSGGVPLGAAGATSSGSSGGNSANRAGGGGAASSAAQPPGSEAGARSVSGPPPATQKQRERWGQGQQQGNARPSSAAGEQQDGEADATPSQQEQPEAQQAGRKTVGVGGTVSLLLGLALMSAAAYCLYTTAPPRPGASPNKAALLDLAGGGPAAAVAAAAAAVERVTRKEGVGSTTTASSGAGDVQSCPAPLLYPGIDQLRYTHPTGDALRSGCPAGSSPGETSTRSSSQSVAEVPAKVDGQDVSHSSSSTSDQDKAAGAQSSAEASPAGSGGPISSRKWLWIPSWLRRLCAALWYSVREVFWAVLFLPRLLLWQPSWQGLASCAMASGGMCLVIPRAYSLLHGESVDKRRLFVRAFLFIWQAGMWLACGGGWLAVLEVAMYLAGPFGRWMEAAPIAFFSVSPVVGYLASHVLRWAVRSLLAPALLLIWRPHWWLHIPFVIAAVAYAMSLPERSLKQFFAQNCAYVLATWYLSRGAWWGMACVLCVVSKLPLRTLRSRHWWAARVLGLLHLIYFGPMVIVVARLIWFWTGSLAAIAFFASVPVGVAAMWLSEPAYAPGAGRSQSSGGRTSGGGWFSFFGWGQKKAPKKPAAGAPPHLKQEVPQGAPEAVAKVLSSGNYFEVLGVSSDAGDAEIRRAKKTLSLATHPDKIGNQPGANEAFNLVIEAADTLSDPDRRRNYDAMLTQLEFEARLSSNRSPAGSIFGGGIFGMGTAAAGSGDDAASDEVLRQVGVPSACPNCGGTHTMFLESRVPSAARFCEECAKYHPVSEGEIWIERSKAGWFSTYELKLYCCWQGLVWDISETGHCEGLFRITHTRGFPFNSHFNLFQRPPSANGSGRQPAPRSERSRVNRKKARRR